MTFMERAIAHSQDIWDNYLKQPFVLEMADGSLDPELFKKYVIQDSLYLKDYARVFALAMYKATTLEDMRAYYSILGFVNENESNTRIKYLREYGISDSELEEIAQEPENKAYTEFMLEVAKNCEAPEILMAVLPCMISYYHIGVWIVENTPNVENGRYYDMISDYSSDYYRESCEKWTAFANKKCEGLSEARKLKLLDIFRKSSEHETNFWDMSYRA